MYEKLLRLVSIMTLALLTSSSFLIAVPTTLAAAQADAPRTTASQTTRLAAFQNPQGAQLEVLSDSSEITPVSPGPITSTLLIANPVSETASVTLRIRDAQGAEVHKSDLSLPAAGLATLSLPPSLGSEFQGSAFLSSDYPLQALAMNANASSTARDLYDGSEAGSNSLIFPIFRHLGNDAQKSIIAVQNLDPVDSAAITLHYFAPDGTEAAGSPLASVNVLPLASGYFDSFQLFGSSVATYSVRVESTKNIAGAEQIRSGADTASLRGLTPSDEGQRFYVDWVERKVASKVVTNWSEIYVRNQGSEAAQVNVTYYLAKGAIKAVETKTVPPNGLGVFSTQPNTKLGNGFSGYALVTETGDQPLAVEWLEVNGGAALYGLQAATSTQAASRWACVDARRFTANPKENTKFKILNTDTAPASLSVTFHDAQTGSAKMTKTLSIKPKAQLSVDLSGRAFQKLGNAYQGLATLESTNGKPLVVSAFSSYGPLGATGYSCAPLPAVSTSAYLPLVVMNWTDSVPTPVQNPHLAIEKQSSETGYSQAGELIHYTITATNDGNTNLASVTVTDAQVSDLACAPTNGSALDPGQSLSCTASHTIVLGDLSAGHLSNQACVDDGDRGAQKQCAEVTTSSTLPPDPGTIAPPLDTSIVTSVLSETEFLYTGSNPIQQGVAPGTIELERAAVLRGKVMTRDNQPLPGVTIRVLGHPEFGHTQSRVDGMFDLAVNGGGKLTVEFAGEGLITAQRQVEAPWEDYAFVPDVVMIEVDPQVTAVDLTASTPIQVARASQVSDSDGSRQATVMLPQGTTAEMTLPDGTIQPLSMLHLRATEFTVGSNGPATMPAQLPPSSGYTYAVEMSADEALAAGATGITFSRPLPFYVENFLGFAVGSVVPVGYYDRTAGEWIPAPNGRVIKVLGVTGGMADLDVEGKGLPADSAALAALGINDAERQELAQLYQPGQSLWRVPLTHFSAWDCNWPYGPPDDATPPNQDDPIPQELDDPCQSGGSIISCESQALGEDLPITGTPFSLHYESDRSAGRSEGRSVTVSLTGSGVPASLKRVELEIGVAGEIFRTQFQPQPDLDYTYTWDGKDAYGRTVEGERVATIKVTYVYPAIYKQPASFAAAFAGLSGGYITGVSRSALEIDSEQVWEGPIGNMQAKPIGLGGWNLSVHHSYDPASRTLYLGDGRRRRQPANAPSIVNVAGGGPSQPGIGDGGPATRALLWEPNGIAVGPDGSLYIADVYHARIRRVGRDGIITTVAGNGANCSPHTDPCGDGGPATQASLSHPRFVALAPDGSMYIVETGNRIRRVRPDGIITTFAGTGNPCTNPSTACGDGGPANQAQLDVPEDIAVGPDGSVYISDTGDRRIRRVGPDGIITTVVGNGEFCNPGNPCGDGGPAALARVTQPRGLAVGPDGSLYFADAYARRVRVVGPDGIVKPVAGSGTACATPLGACGDGGLALEAEFNEPSGLAVDRTGAVYITDIQQNRVRRVDSDGIITAVAGSGASCASLYAPCGDGGPATQAQLNRARSVAVGPDNTLYVSDTNDNRIRQLKPFLNGFSTADSIVAAEDGSEAYLFNHLAQHVRTLSALTGATLYEFAYDAAGRLTSVTDGDGNVTSIEHDANGNPSAVVSPFGQRTSLTVDDNGYLKSITNPANETIELTSTPGGLLKTLTDARGGLHQFTYDAGGRLTKDEDPAGGSKTLARTENGNGYTVTMTTALGRTTTYKVDWQENGYRRVIVEPTGAQTEIVWSITGQTVTLLPDGTMLNVQQAPDPRFGMQAPLPRGVIITTPGGVSSTIIMTRTVALADPPNPFSLTNQTDKVAVNGRVFTKVYDAAARTFTATSPVGRQQTVTIDAQGRVVGESVAGLAPYAFNYDAHGRLSAIAQESGSEAWNVGVTYNGNGYVQDVTDALSRVTNFTYDAAGRLKQATLPGSRTYAYDYDANGNVKSVTPPERSAHGFAYAPTDLLESYSPPDVQGGAGQTGYQHNTDRQLKRVTLPAGQTIDLSYDTAGRLETITLPRGQVGYSYSAETGRLSSIHAPGGLDLSFSYDGSLRTGETWSGPVAGSVTHTYDKNLRAQTVSVNGTSIGVQYDTDSLPIQVGDLTLTRDPATGFLSGSGIGTVTDRWTYNSFGEPMSYGASAGGTPVYAVEFQRDALGRITVKTETIGGQTATYTYIYADPAGWLKEVKKDGVTVATYDVDPNGNRKSATLAGATVTATFDGQDRLLQYGYTSYTYTQDGRLQSKTRGGETISYEYDELGNLLSVARPDGKLIEYWIDGQNRRVGKKVNGELVQAFLYDGRLRPIAELDGAGNVISRFVYGAGINVPHYMIKSGTNYRIVQDYLGSPRLVINATTGEIVQRMDYDEFGNILNDTQPGFQPFGYAGGLYDRDTGLIRFGARDYDPQIGRWTTKDPIGFRDGHSNLYLYSRADPINLTDPAGLDCGSPWRWAKDAFDVAKGVFMGVFEKTPPVISELEPLASDEGAEAERSAVTALQRKKAMDVLNNTGNVEEYNRILNMPLSDFLNEFAPGWNGSTP